MSREKGKYSEFAEALRRLLYDSKIFTIKEWVEFLGITRPAISQWLNDETMPRPELLRIIVAEVKRSSGVPPDVVEQFEVMAAKPASQVLPSSRKLEGTIGSYLVSPLLNGFVRDLQRLPAPEQEDVLLGASEDCAIRAGIINRPTVLLGETPTTPEPIKPTTTETTTPEAFLASLGAEADELYDQISFYLVGSRDKNLRAPARTFCLEALSRVRTHEEKTAENLMTEIIRSMPDEDISKFTFLPRMKEALTCLFVADKEIRFLVRGAGPDTKFKELEHNVDFRDVDGVRAISSQEVKFGLANRIASYRKVNLDASISQLVPDKSVMGVRANS